MSTILDDLHLSAQAAMHNGQYELAYKQLTSLISADNRFADAYFLLARIANEFKNYLKERELLECACELQPDNAEYRTYLARAYALTGDMQSAFVSAEKASRMSGHNALSMDALGVVYSRLNLYQEAKSWFLLAVEIEQNSPAIYFNLGSTLKFCGDFDGARKAFESAISLNHLYYKAHAALTSLGGITSQCNHIQTLKELRAFIKNDDYLYVSHALSKELEAVGNYDESFAVLKDAKTRKLPATNYEFSQDLAVFTALRDFFKSTKDSARSGYDHEGAIFVVGMPRTGTTLVERIISSHSEASTAGELHNFGLIVKGMLNNCANSLMDKNLISAAHRLDYRTLGAAYIESTRHLYKGNNYLVDKLPLNVLYAGFIIRALPRAKIICLDRSPMDTILSNYRQLFSFNDMTYGYSLDLMSVARYYLEFKKLVSFWAAYYPDNFYVINYDVLVKSPEREIKKLLAFCGLDWQPQCLEIEKNKSPVATASSIQVRKPISADSIGQWKKYDRHLSEIKILLTQAGIGF